MLTYDDCHAWLDTECLECKGLGHKAILPRGKITKLADDWYQLAYKGYEGEESYYKTFAEAEEDEVSISCERCKACDGEGFVTYEEYIDAFPDDNYKEGIGG